jgi:hypothetical protein
VSDGQEDEIADDTESVSKGRGNRNGVKSNSGGKI